MRSMASPRRKAGYYLRKLPCHSATPHSLKAYCADRTTNHLERLDPALSRPGRMDVWVEFKNASKWQAEALFRNFFPCEEEEEPPVSDAELESLDIDANLQVQDRDGKVRTFVPAEARPRAETPGSGAAGPTPPSLWSLSTSFASSATSLLSGATSPTLASSNGAASPPPPTPSGPPACAPVPATPDKDQFGATNTAYQPPPPDPSLTKVKLLDKRTLAALAKKFADGLPDDEFSVAGLQGCACIFGYVLSVRF